MFKIISILCLILCISISTSFAANGDEQALGEQYARCIKKAGNVGEANLCLETAGKYWQSIASKEIIKGKALCEDAGSESCPKELVTVGKAWKQYKESLEQYTMMAMGQSQMGMSQMLMNTALISKNYADMLVYINSAITTHNK